MPNVLIRDLPADVHAVLTRRAETAGQSLQQFLVTALERMARTPTPDELFDRLDAGAIRRRGRIGFASAVSALDEGRADRDRR